MVRSQQSHAFALAHTLCYDTAIMRVLIISDIHANLVAFEEVLNHAKQQYDTVWCLGDIVGYGPRPNECVELVRDIAECCVMGNHDWAALGRPGVNVDDFNPQARRAVLWTREQLTSENRDYLNALYDDVKHPLDSDVVAITHASPREPVWEYILTPSIAMENFAIFHGQICLFGHTHRPAVYRWQFAPASDAQTSHTEMLHYDPQDDLGGMDTHPVERVHDMARVDHLLPQLGQCLQLEASETQRLLINPGSVGQPRDNDSRAAYAILDLEQMTWDYRRVAYPIELTQSQMRAAKLPKRLVDRLSFGW